MLNTAERRRARRYELAVRIQVDLNTTDPCDVLQGQTQNISSGGMYFTIPCDCVLRSYMQFNLVIPRDLGHGKDVFIFGQCTVVRVDKDEEGRRGRVGVAAIIDKYSIVGNKSNLF